ncbi:AAA family ATPase [Mesorhizobium escarrei]|uniref:AAA_23 domain-containing protein n=1 Tax=Mesorhizobium escarrei TaxID=666018 RepID=A0ABM9E317_9HYPH|nr:AAA family ATPase [Mesorhizobium escarrei]CAH2402993.1 AAA_23 domain-containing protein [Mesorhizobium escarrei]
MWVERIELNDFRCFYGTREIEFSTDREKNVTLIHAENGVGKTTILNAMLWCFYGMTTPKFEQKEDLLNHDAARAGRTTAYVEVSFEHNGNYYRARRYAPPNARFALMRLDRGHSEPLSNPDTFINTVIPKSMASHFLFDGEHAEVFLGEEKRHEIRSAVQDILGCSLVKTAIKDLEEVGSQYRRQMPKRGGSSAETLNEQIERLGEKITRSHDTAEVLKDEVVSIQQQIADIDEQLRNSSAAKELQARREDTEKALKRARDRETSARDETVKWLGDNARFLVSTKLTAQTFDHLESQETKGRIPSPYNEEFVKDLLEMEKCICGAPLHPGSEPHLLVAGLLKKAANHTLRSRLNAIRAIMSQLKDKRERAPGELDAAYRREAEARAEVARLEPLLTEISEKLVGINFGEIGERERRRNQLRSEERDKQQKVWNAEREARDAETDKLSKERELEKQVQGDAEAQIFIKRYHLCETLKGQLEKELTEDETSARRVLGASINKILAQTRRKDFRLRMSPEYGVSLVNDAGTQLPKSGGENQLLGLAFTAALVEFAKQRENAEGFRLLKGTVAPLILDSPFGQLDESYRATVAQHVPQMAAQVILMVSGSQGSGGVVEALRPRVGKEFVLVRQNRAPRGERPVEIRQFRGRDFETARFDAEFDGTLIEEVA